MLFYLLLNHLMLYYINIALFHVALIMLDYFDVALFDAALCTVELLNVVLNLRMDYQRYTLSMSYYLMLEFLILHHLMLHCLMFTI